MAHAPWGPHSTFASLAPQQVRNRGHRELKASGGPGAGFPCPGWITGKLAQLQLHPSGASDNHMMMPTCWEWGPSSVSASAAVSLLQNISGTFSAKFPLLGGADHTQTSLLILTGTLIALGNSALTHRLSRNIIHLLLFPKQKQ